MKIYPYKQGSASAKALAQALGCKVLFREGKKIRTDYLINWGCSRIDREVYVGQQEGVINYPESVAKASNKLTTLKLFAEAGVACPEFTERRDEAQEWLAKDAVVVRKLLNGHSGAGIEIIDPTGLDVEVPEAPLYTKYIKKDQEYRIHVAGGEVIFQQRKARKKEVADENVNWQVRNLAGGFIFANADVVAPDNVQTVAIAAVAALGLDFGAADVITNKKGEAFCLEVNTACGLAGKTIDAYVKYFRSFE